MAFFWKLGEPAPEKITFTVNSKNDRFTAFKEIVSALTGAFQRIFETKELYSMKIDITLTKNRKSAPTGYTSADESKEEKPEPLDNVDVMD